MSIVNNLHAQQRGTGAMKGSFLAVFQTMALGVQIHWTILCMPANRGKWIVYAAFSATLIDSLKTLFLLTRITVRLERQLPILSPVNERDLSCRATTCLEALGYSLRRVVAHMEALEIVANSEDCDAKRDTIAARADGGSGGHRIVVPYVGRWMRNNRELMRCATHVVDGSSSVHVVVGLTTPKEVITFFPKRLREPMSTLMDLLASLYVNIMFMQPSSTLLFQEAYGDLVRLGENVGRLWLVKARLAESERFGINAHVAHEEEVALYSGLIVNKDKALVELRLERVALQKQAHKDGRTIATIRQQWDRLSAKSHLSGAGFEPLKAEGVGLVKDVPLLATIKPRGNPLVALPVEELGRIPDRDQARLLIELQTCFTDFSLLSNKDQDISKLITLENWIEFGFCLASTSFLAIFVKVPQKSAKRPKTSVVPKHSVSRRMSARLQETGTIVFRYVVTNEIYEQKQKLSSSDKLLDVGSNTLVIFQQEASAGPGSANKSMAELQRVKKAVGEQPIRWKESLMWPKLRWSSKGRPLKHGIAILGSFKRHRRVRKGSSKRETC
ncbi:hypothetical protein Patl1_17936 [Pistacia atlantica]|uniref:Uncharacterized protein n=1 Tax=Pistacia atlantica TaxID=434234 RepID=A0ACC1BZK9_9ROSI|nr:hypothetical protein Patl1_17936 [Pistacia atlantica]